MIHGVTGSFRERINALQDGMPRKKSNGFEVPTKTDLARWRGLVDSLLNGEVSLAKSLVEEHFPSYALLCFTDTATDHAYLLLQELPSTLKGWGAVVLNLAPDRDLAIEVPHPVYDVNTHMEGADLFQKTGARVLIMAGTDRRANSAPSPCNGSKQQSDMAHVIESPFQVTHEAFTDRFLSVTTLSLHGYGDHRKSSCETVFFSGGVKREIPQSVRNLREALQERGVEVGIPDGTSSCTLVGSKNVQGRYTNGSSQPCKEAATSATGRFIHIEQCREFREEYDPLINAVKAAFKQNCV